MRDQSLFYQFVTNKTVFSAFFGWFVAQMIKVVLGIIRERRFNFKWFVGTGGMPSSHASGVTSLATCVGLYQGVDSVLFGITLMFTVIVIFDAQGVRRATGQQAEILNAILEDIYFKKKIPEKKLKELIGHTPFQVIMGILLGLAVAFFIYYMSGGN